MLISMSGASCPWTLKGACSASASPAARDKIPRLEARQSWPRKAEIMAPRWWLRVVLFSAVHKSAAALAAKWMNRGGRASSPRFTSLVARRARVVCCDDTEQGYPGYSVRARGRPRCACSLLKSQRRGEAEVVTLRHEDERITSRAALRKSVESETNCKMQAELSGGTVLRDGVRTS